MTKSFLLASAALLFSGTHSFAQDTTAAEAAATNPGDIIITATKRAQALSDVPIAVSAVTAESLANSGAADIRQLNQLAPSLLVSSATSEGNGAARIRGVGTVGENPGLESSVAVFIDGVYRSRTGIGLTELGDIERIEVLRGPQGTLFGRNASAGLLNIITKKPQFELGGSAEATYGNYDYYKIAGSVTGPLIADTLAASLNAVYVKRDGFLTDRISGRDVNDRDRYLVRGQLLFTPGEDISLRLIADYSKKAEECCAAAFLPTRNVARDASGNVVFSPNSIVAFGRNLFGGNINDNTYARETSITPGLGYRFDSKDYGLSAELNWDLGAASLTSITAYRVSKISNGQDGDFSNLDLVTRQDRRQEFKTFTQEVRVQGTVFDDRLDWLVGGFYANEKLDLVDDIKFGSQLGPFLTCQFAGALGAANVSPASPGCLNPLARPTLNAVFGTAFTSLFDNLYNMRNVGANPNSYAQKGENYAIFTHNVFSITDSLKLTLGGRYTKDKKDLNTIINNNNPACGLNRTAFGQALAFAALPTTSAAAAGAIRALGPTVFGTACASNLNTLANGTFAGSRKEDKFTGTAVVSFKPTDDLLTYASYSIGYKAGGFNLDQAGFLPTTGAVGPNVSQLGFEPETVTAYELGAKFDSPKFRLNGAIFLQQFKNFQLNTFNGVNFIVENVGGCRDSLGGRDRNLVANDSNCAVDRLKAGVTSRGVEVEAAAYPVDILQITAGATIAKTKYADDIAGFQGRSFAPGLFQLPGSQISNAPKYVLTGSAALTPEISGTGLTSLIYADFRYQGSINTGSDLDPEKVQPGYIVMNARLGIYGEGKRWGVELWAQNLLNQEYQQVGADAPLQGSGTIGAVRAGLQPTSNAAFITFLGEPRTFGITLKGKF
jgi:iron complex outermembrane recepter protein